MTYTVEIRPAAARQLKKLTRVVQAQVIQQLEELELDPRPPDVKKLSGKNNLYRVRVGEYRIVYEIQDAVLLVLVLAVGHRREIYRDLS
jgi:mRNA interferase RelE/StbE